MGDAASVPLLIVLDGERRVVAVSRPEDFSLRGTKLRRTLERLLAAQR
jgi:hypothetical protein